MTAFDVERRAFSPADLHLKVIVRKLSQVMLTWVERILNEIPWFESKLFDKYCLIPFYLNSCSYHIRLVACCGNIVKILQIPCLQHSRGTFFRATGKRKSACSLGSNCLRSKNIGSFIIDINQSTNEPIRHHRATLCCLMNDCRRFCRLSSIFPKRKKSISLRWKNESSKRAFDWHRDEISQKFSSPDDI